MDWSKNPTFHTANLGSPSSWMAEVNHYETMNIISLSLQVLDIHKKASHL